MSLSQEARLRRERTPAISDTIIERVAEAEGVAPTELEARLYDTIDPDALNELYAQWDAKNVADGLVSFEFHGYEVTVQSDGTVTVAPDSR